MKKKCIGSKAMAKCAQEILQSNKDYVATIEYISMLFASKILKRCEYKWVLKSIDARLMLAKIKSNGYGEIKIKPSNTILSMLGEENDQVMYLKITPDATERFEKDFQKSIEKNNNNK